jgi:hypothetical protein
MASGAQSETRAQPGSVVCADLIEENLVVMAQGNALHVRLRLTHVERTHGDQQFKSRVVDGVGVDDGRGRPWFAHNVADIALSSNLEGVGAGERVSE